MVSPLCCILYIFRFFPNRIICWYFLFPFIRCLTNLLVRWIPSSSVFSLIDDSMNLSYIVYKINHYFLIMDNWLLMTVSQPPSLLKQQKSKWPCRQPFSRMGTSIGNLIDTFDFSIYTRNFRLVCNELIDRVGLWFIFSTAQLCFVSFFADACSWLSCYYWLKYFLWAVLEKFTLCFEYSYSFLSSSKKLWK